MRGQRWPGQPAVASGKYLRNAVDLKPAFPDFQQGSCNSPHHVLKKATAPYPEYPFIVRAGPGCVKYCPGAILDLGRSGTEGSEIVRAEEIRRTPIELVFVQRIAERIDVTAMEGADDGISPDVVFIRLGAGGTAGVKLRTDLLNGQNPDLDREKSVGSTQHGIRVHRPDGFDIRYLPVRVDSRIGAAGANNLNVVIEKFLQSLLNLALDGLELRLNLPAVESRAVIGKCQLEVPHSIRL